MEETYGQPQFKLDPESRIIRASFLLKGVEASAVGYQIFDPETGTFVLEGEWQRLQGNAERKVEMDIALPPEKGHYHVYLSPVDEIRGWSYQLGKPFLLIDAFVENGRARLVDAGTQTLRRLRFHHTVRSVGKAFTLPLRSVRDNWGLIHSMVRRDLAARYRGSFGDILWAVLNPLLLISTYFFVFGIVLQSSFGPDKSRTGFVLYLVSGMLPWLAFSEAVGRSPHVLLEHRNFIKKLVFPVEILPVTQTISALMTEGFALVVFLGALLVIRGALPATSFWLPVLLIPQVLFTVGIAWILSSLGVFMRDLSQIIGFLLTLWFWLTPICYPESPLPPGAAEILTKNPIYVLVRGYRAIFLENSAPAFHSLWKLWVVACVVFVAGHACFYKLRKSFADVI
ncbi:MAG: ABC transporter permease [Bryobacteraceae bacterium]|nr:ABC transporter permease [Bryobacteraceae bacterium]